MGLYEQLGNVVLRRQWLNQILSWCIRGSINKVKYTRGQMVAFIEHDVMTEPDIAVTIPEAAKLLEMFKADMSVASIETYIRMAL